MPTDVDICYFQENKMVSAFMNYEYDENDSTTSYVEQFVTKKRNDEPLGVIFDTVGSEVIVMTNDCEKVLIPKHGKAAIYNIPGTGAEYCVIKDGNIIRKGTIRPCDKLRMIKMTSHAHKPFNIRDLGGKKCCGGEVKYGKIFRGAELNGEYFGVSPTNADRKILCGELGISCELDLRRDDERFGITSSVLGDNVQYENHPVSAYSDGLHDERYRKLIQSIISHVVNGDVLYIHCVLGADRTGTLCAILEGLLGVDRDDIDKDYELTSFAGGLRKRNSESWQSFVREMNTFDGATFCDKTVNWALSIGITHDEIDSFRSCMIDKDHLE